MEAALRTLDLLGPWQRLHRAESEALAGLLTMEEREAVRRRLGQRPARTLWIPASAGETGSRFAAPHGPGALYLADDLAVCVQEVRHHHARHCAASEGTPAGTRAVFRHLVFRVAGRVADAVRERRGGLHDPADYAPSWGYGRRVRAAGLAGVHYRSVRSRGGRCLAVFEEPVLRFLRVELGAVVLEWDGSISRRIA